MRKGTTLKSILLALIGVVMVVGVDIAQTPPEVQLCVPALESNIAYHKVEFKKIHLGQEYFFSWFENVTDTLLENVSYTEGDTLFARMLSVDDQGGMSEWSEWSDGFYYAGPPPKPVSPTWNCEVSN